MPMMRHVVAFGPPVCWSRVANARTKPLGLMGFGMLHAAEVITQASQSAAGRLMANFNGQRPYCSSPNSRVIVKVTMTEY